MLEKRRTIQMESLLIVRIVLIRITISLSWKFGHSGRAQSFSILNLSLTSAVGNVPALAVIE